MENRQCFTVICAMAAISLVTAEARTLHVAMSGDDKHSGTPEAPLRTMQKAAEVSRAGDTVLVHAGVYRGHLLIRSSGEPGKPVIFKNVICSNRAYGIQVAAYPFKPESHAGPEFATAQRWLICHNTIAFQQNRGGIVVWQPEATDCVIENNIFYRNAVKLGQGDCQGIEFVAAGTNHIIRNNLFVYLQVPRRTSHGLSRADSLPATVSNCCA